MFLQKYELLFLEKYEILIYSFIGFFIPFFLAGPQLLVGSIVNALLVIAALRLNNEKILPLIFLPSLGVLARGLVFGPWTWYLVYFIPFIWASNYLFVILIKKYKENKLLSITIPSFFKALFLTGIALILVGFNIVPDIFLIAMSIFQLATALIGSSIVILSKSFINKQ